MTQDDIIKMARDWKGDGMTTLREAAQQALKSLGDAITAWTEEVMFRSSIDASDEWLESYAALREALAQPEQKPVAVVVAAEYEDGSHAGHHLEWRGRNEANDYPEGTEFYTSPPQRKPLTEEEILKAWKPFEGNPFTTKYEFARAIEKAHGIGGEE